MYIIYETYTDDTRNIKEMRFNTKIVGAYYDERIAKAELEKHIELTISKVNEEQDWFVRQFDKKIIKDEFDNIIKVYEVFNEYALSFSKPLAFKQLNIYNSSIVFSSNFSYKYNNVSLFIFFISISFNL